MSIAPIPSSSRRDILTPLEREMLVTVFQDSIDQLSVLEQTIPAINKPSATSDSLSEALVEILENQHRLEEKFYNLTLSDDKGVPPCTTVKNDVHSLSVATQATNNIKVLGENMKKLQTDRLFLQSVYNTVIDEVCQSGTFESLKNSVIDYQEEKESMQEGIMRAQANEKRIRFLKRQLRQVKKDRDDNILRLEEDIAHCKDQLQEIKARSGLVNKFVKKQTEVRVQCNRQHNTIESGNIEQEKSTITQQLGEEKRAHSEVENYLKKHIEDLDGKVEYWMGRYDSDLENKIMEVQDLKLAKTTGLQKLDELSKTYKEREDIVVEHRAMKEKQRRKEEHERKQNQTATKLQSWWRGVMVRKKLGPYGKGKKKGKKGKKGKKKGKKKN